MSLLRVRNLNTGYGKKQVLFDVSLDIEVGETILLIGANGSGKSTLLKAIYRLLPIWEIQDQGLETSINYNDIDLQYYKTYELIDKGIAYIPQQNILFSGMTVFQNLETALLHLKNKVTIENRIHHVFEQFPTLFDKRKQDANQLSGGERKILSLGMAMVNRPKLLLLDEPTAGISSDRVALIYSVLEMFKESGTALIIVEHRIKELFKFANRVIGIKQGKLADKQILSISNAKKFLV